MSTSKRIYAFLATLIVLAAVLMLGCNTGSKPTTSSNGQHEHSDGEAEHGHEPGSHGGQVVEVGQDNYHLEAVVDAEGKLHIYMLGRDETRVQEVEEQQLQAYAKPDGGAAVQITLAPDRQEGDTEGKTSAFVGELPQELRGQQLEIHIPSLRIDGERFRVSFTTDAEHNSQDGHGSVPPKVTNEAEQALYLTPGGAYTAADIAANGRQTASQKFAGFNSRHDLKPQVGDRICPVTLTKANAECTWIVAGQEYQFCCPPCVDEFVALAKEDPDALKQPDEYIKQ